MTVELRGITWDHPRGLGGLTATAEAYAATRPDVRVDWQVRSLQAFADQSIAGLAERFDLIYIDHPAIGEAVARGCLVPLDDHLDAGFLAGHAAASVGRSADSYEWEGHRWALATDAAAQVAAYRPDLLEASGLTVPATWDDVRAAAAALRSRGRWIAMPAIPVDSICAFLAVCVAVGEEPLTADDDRVVSREAGRTALDLIAAVLSVAHPASLDWNPPRMLEHMATEDDVAYCPLAFGYSNYARPGFRPSVVRAGPGPAGSDGVPRGTLGGAGLAVSASSAAVVEAAQYAAYVADSQVQRTVYVEGGGQPGHRGAWTDDAVNDATGEFFRDTLTALDAAYLRPRHDGFIAFQDAAGHAVHGWLANGHPAAGVDGVLDVIDAAHRESLRSPAGAERTAP